LYGCKKAAQKIWATSAIFKKTGLPTVNNRPIGENSPNLVTLEMMAVINKYDGVHLETGWQKRILYFIEFLSSVG
jgi:hypothetical protein